MRLHYPALLSVLLMQLRTSTADTVLGGVVDYLPKCYANPSAMVYVEYNSGHCYREPFPIKRPCSCNSDEIARERQNYGGTMSRCVWVVQVNEYKASDNTTNSTTDANTAEDAHNIPLLEPLYSRNHGGPYSTDSNAPVIQGIAITNNSTRYLGVSIWKGIRMIRFQYLKIGQREGWSQGVQLRFTDDLKKRLSKRDFGDENRIRFFPAEGMIDSNMELIIDTHCFYVTALVPFERRTSQHHLINCMKVQLSKVTTNLTRPGIFEKTNGVAQIANCEQGTNLKNINDTPKNILIEGLRHISSLGLSFIPVVGPFLSIGLDVTFDLIQDKSKFDGIMNSAQVSAGDEVFKLLTIVGKKFITR